MNVGTAGTIGADVAVIVSATYNCGHFALILRGIARELRARRLAAAALVLLNAGVALEALHLLAMTATDLSGRDPDPLVGGTAALTRGAALVGSFLISALILRDRLRAGGKR